MARYKQMKACAFLVVIVHLRQLNENTHQTLASKTSFDAGNYIELSGNNLWRIL